MSDYSLSPWGRSREAENNAPTYNTKPSYTGTTPAYEYSPNTATFTAYPQQSQPQRASSISVWGLQQQQQPQQASIAVLGGSSQRNISALNGFNLGQQPQRATLSPAPAHPSSGSVYSASSSSTGVASQRSNFLNQAPQTATEYVLRPTYQNSQKSLNAVYGSKASLTINKVQPTANSASTANSAAAAPPLSPRKGFTTATTICSPPRTLNAPQLAVSRRTETSPHSGPSTSPSPKNCPQSTSPQIPTQVNVPKLPEKSLNESKDSVLSPRKECDSTAQATSAPVSDLSKSSSGELGQSEQKSLQESRKWRRKHDVSDSGNGDQVTLKDDGSSLGPWKLQPEQPLPKKAESALVKARLYLEQVKKKPSDELIQNRTDKIKMLSGIPDWVPDEESPVCTFCGKIFNVIARRHHCRKCGGLYCGDCTNWRIRLANDPDKKLVRVCTECFCSCIINALGTYAGSAMTEDEDLRPKGSGGGSKVTIICVTGGGVSGNYGNEENLPEDKEDRRRYLCVQEIINTEKSYVDDLEALVNVYMTPIKASGALTNEQFTSLFSCVEVLLPMHKKIVEDLSKDEEFVGRAFMSMCSFLKMYSSYCANQEKAIELIERLKGNIEFMKVLNDCLNDPRAKGQNLSSYIIKPVQRICKYPLLFRELISHTPETNPDYKSMIETKDKIDEVVTYINERKRRAEQQRKMIEIHSCVEGEWEEDLVVPARYWISEYRLQGKALGRPSKISDYMLFLFNNLLVVTKIIGSYIPGQHSKIYTLKGFIPLTECRIIVISDTDSEKNSFEVSRVGSSGNASAATAAAVAAAAAAAAANGGKEQAVPVRFQFFCETESERDLIVKEIRSVIKEMQKLIFSGKMIGSDTLLASMTSSTSIQQQQQQQQQQQLSSSSISSSSSSSSV